MQKSISHRAVPYDCPRLGSSVTFKLKITHFREHSSEGDGLAFNSEVPSVQECTGALRCGVATEHEYSTSYDWSECPFIHTLKAT